MSVAINVGMQRSWRQENHLTEQHKECQHQYPKEITPCVCLVPNNILKINCIFFNYDKHLLKYQQ